MRMIALSLTLAGLFAFTTPARSADLGIGDTAPKLEVTEWIKGDSINIAARENNEITVVEFWATWCGPCIASIPHLNDVQHNYGPKGVNIVAVTKFDEGNTRKQVEEFVAKQGEKMDYRVAFEKDPNTYEAYMDAADQHGIPTAFIVDQKGRIAWIGHPLSDLDQTLDEMVAGKYDIALARKIFDLRDEMGEAWREGDFDKVLKLANRRIALKPTDTGAYRSKFRVYLDELDKPEEARAAAEKVIALAGDDADTLASFAQELIRADEKHKLSKLATRAVTRALEIQPTHTDAGIANFQILATSGDETAAIEWASRSIKRLTRDAAGLARFARVLSAPERAGRCTPLALRAVELAIQAEPDAPKHLRTKFNILATCKKDLAAAARVGGYLIEKANDDASLLNAFAWSLLTEDDLKGKFNELALAAATRCDKASGGENWMYVDTFAFATFENGATEKAIKLQKKAIDLAGDNPAVEELKERLEEFKNGIE